jgi:hypothetical protein
VTNGIRGALGVRSAVDDFTFKVNLVAVVRVRANDESIARKFVPEVLERPALLKSAWPMRTMLRRVITQR